MSWILDGRAGSFADLIGLRPNLAADLADFAEVFWSRALVEPVVLELCRLRVAGLHGCDAELAALAEWYRVSRFSAGERACLQVAEQFVMDPSAISDADFAAAREHLGEASMVALLEALALFDGFSRFQVMLEARPETEDSR